MLPMSKQLRFLATALLHRISCRAMKVKPYVPDFKLALERFYIHAGRSDMLDELEHSLGLSA